MKKKARETGVVRENRVSSDRTDKDKIESRKVERGEDRE